MYFLMGYIELQVEELWKWVVFASNHKRSEIAVQSSQIRN